MFRHDRDRHKYFRRLARQQVAAATRHESLTELRNRVTSLPRDERDAGRAVTSALDKRQRELSVRIAAGKLDTDESTTIGCLFVRIDEIGELLPRGTDSQFQTPPRNIDIGRGTMHVDIV